MTTTAIANINDLRNALAAKLQAQKNSMPPAAGVKIRATRDGFVLPDGSTTNTINAVVVDVRYINTFYEGRYTPNDPKPPVCWALDADANTLAPNEASPKPVHDACSGCPKNEFGSAGKGKACKNMVRIAIITPDADVKSGVYMIDLAPTSTTPFLKTLRGLKVPIQTVELQLTMDETVDYPKVLTKVVGPASDDLAPIILGMVDKAQDLINRGFDYAA